MTSYLLFIDTESSGLPKDWDKPYSAEGNWPFCVQIAWIIYTKEGHVVKQENYFIKENDFKISKSATRIHGITQSFLQVNGQRRKEVMERLSYDVVKYRPLIIGHFMEFDYEMLGADFYRTGIVNPIKKEMTFCTMLATTHMIENPALKFFRLGELYELLFHTKLYNQHNALVDAKATADCFFELIKRGEVTDETIALQQIEASRTSHKEERTGCLIPVLFIILLFYYFIILLFPMNDRLEILNNTVPFNTLPEDVLIGVSDLLEYVQYNKEAVIYQQEVTKMNRVDIIVKGEYETFFYDSAQNKRSVEVYLPGSCYGGISVLLNRKRSLKTVIAKKGTVVYTLPRKAFVELCQSFENFFHLFHCRFWQAYARRGVCTFCKRADNF